MFKRFTYRILPVKFVIITTIFFTSFSLKAQQWNSIGGEAQLSAVASSYTSIAVFNNVPYVVYVEGTTSGIVKVKKRNLSSGAWEQVGANLATNASYSKIYSDRNGKLYVTYIDVSGSGGNKLAVVTFNTTSQAWEPLVTGNLYASSNSVTYTSSASITRSSLAFDNSNTPYVVYSDRSGTTGYPVLKRFISGAWQTVGGTSVSTDFAVSVSIALDNADVPYLTYVQQANATAGTGPIKTFRLNSAGTSWQDISPASPVLPGTASTGATSSVRFTSIALDSANNPVVSYFNTSNGNRSTIIRYNKTTAAWNWIGAISTRDANNNSLINDNGGNVYNIFSDALSGGLANMVRVFKLYRNAMSFTELKNAGYTRGIDSTGPDDNTTRSVTISDLAIAVGNDTSKPFITYTKTYNGVRTPVVQVFIQPVATKPVTGISATSATTGGTVSPEVFTSITERGIVYSTSINPTTADTKMIDGQAVTGSFTSTITGLQAATAYHVRAYAITSTGTVFYGNDILFTTTAPDLNSVTIADNGTTVILNNGIIKATISKTDATVTSLLYNGLELISGGYNGGSVYWSWNMPNYQNPTNCIYTLTANPASNSYNYAEVKLHMSWDGTSTTAAMDVDIYYSLPRNASGLYASATLSHPASYPALTGGEWRMASYPNPMFDWMSVDSLRNRLMANLNDLNNAAVVSGAPVEVTRLTTGIYANQYECKYDYSADFGAINTWGWSSTANNVGLWITAPSKEYYPGGPMKRELMCHVSPVLLNMLGGTHYGQGSETAVAAGEDWQKTYGPFLIYCNKVPAGTANASTALWNDAKAQALTEQAAWPYSWYTNPSYVQETGRGTVTGKLVISDASNPTVAAANAWIGLAIPPTGTSAATNFEKWSKNYQFWVKTDAAGNFTIPHVFPGTYSLFAFGGGAIGQLSLANYTTVTAGNTNVLGTITWTPDRIAPTVWEIGVPDRSAAEFKHGTDWWTSNVYPNANWAKFMDYTTEFPNGVTYTIGQSNPVTDWNFVQPYNTVAAMNQASAPEWKVKFSLSAAPTTGTNSSIYVAAASSFAAPFYIKVNGTNITTPATGIDLPNASNATIRKGIHGAFGDLRFTFPSDLLVAGENEISFTVRRSGGDIQYDYIRLEAPAAAVILPVSLTPLKLTRVNNTAVLSWSTLNETNNSHFEIERYTKGGNFRTIGTVGGKGNSTHQQDYSFTDKQPSEGWNFYRIKQIDKDGKSSTTNTVNYYNGSSYSTALLIYPNPAHYGLVAHYNATTTATVSCSIFDYKSAIVKQFQANVLNGSNLLQTDIANLSPGTYLLKVTCNGQITTAPFIKQ